MSNKNILKEDATKRLIELLRETDTLPEDEEKLEAVSDEAAAAPEPEPFIEDSSADDASGVSPETLLDFLNQENSEASELSREIPGIGNSPVEAMEKKRRENDPIADLYHTPPEHSATGSADDTPLRASQTRNTLQNLLANLDSTMNSDDQVEILGAQNGAAVQELLQTETVEKNRPEQTEKPKPPIIDSAMAKSVAADPQKKPEPEPAPKRSLKYLKKYNYDDLYSSEKGGGEEYIPNWNTAKFFQSVLFSKDTAYGLDMGEDYVRYVQIKKRQDKLEISDWGFTQLIQNENNQNTGYIRKKNEDNFDIVFSNYAAQTRLKNRYVAHAIQNKNVVSRLLSFPKLAPAEVKEAIELNARKNLPFPDKFAQIDYAQTGSSTEGQKKFNYLVAIGHERSINGVFTRFKDAGIVPRKLFSASFAIWSLFKNNYPDLEDQSVILLHIGEDVSNIVFINEGVFQFDRELAIGAKDFREALAQKVSTLDGDHVVTLREAEQLKVQYGFPIDQEGVTEFLHIEAFKLQILLRSEGERLLSEINRSIDFYRKVFSLPALECDIFLSGPGSKVPNIDVFISRQLNRTVRHIFSLRSTTVRYAEGVEPIPVEFMPEFDLALAAATEIDNHTNLVPKVLKFEEKFIPAYMASIIILLLTLLAVTVSSFAISSKLTNARQKVKDIETEIADVAPMGTKYTDMISYHNAAFVVRNELNHDRYFSAFIPTILKALSRDTQEEIKLSQLIFNRESAEPKGAGEKASAAKSAAHPMYLHLQGFVTTSDAIADVVLTNYQMKLEGTGYFNSVQILSKNRETGNGLIRLRFTMQAELKE